MISGYLLLLKENHVFYEKKKDFTQKVWLPIPGPEFDPARGRRLLHPGFHPSLVDKWVPRAT